jgi:hypothetical protein
MEKGEIQPASYKDLLNPNVHAHNKKLLNPTVLRGQTAWPKESGDQEKHGVRYDYDGEKEIDGVTYHKFQMQANAGNKIPSTIKNWLGKAEGGIHAIMDDVLIPKDK